VNETIKDEVLLENARHGDQHAFLLLYERHHNRIFRFLFRLLGSAAIAEDLTHDCFMTLLREPEGSQSSALSPLRTRLYSTARTLAIEFFHNSAQKPSVKDVLQDDAISKRNMRNTETHDGSLVSEVGEAVACLPHLEREALILAEYEGLKLDEIATIVGADAGIVSARLTEARARLRRLLAHHLYSKQ
jgi:RNA polymerase sigma-70 factor (ECF subfamily)